MSSFWLPVIWFYIIIIECAFHWWYSYDSRDHRPVIIIFFEMLLFWIASPIGCKQLPILQWWMMWAWMPLFWWAFFQPILNWMNGRYICYLSRLTWMNRFQRDNGGEVLWFFIRFGLAWVSLVFWIWRDYKHLTYEHILFF